LLLIGIPQAVVVGSFHRTSGRWRTDLREGGLASEDETKSYDQPTEAECMKRLPPARGSAGAKPLALVVSDHMKTNGCPLAHLRSRIGYGDTAQITLHIRYGLIAD
jgi:hypothetical protein